MAITLKNLQKKIPLPKAKILKAAQAANVSLRATASVGQYDRAKRSNFFHIENLSIVFVGAKRMRMLNKKYLKHDYVTDVLTFDIGEGQAEIIICPQVASINAKAHRTSTEKEIILYVVHGILHLAGFNDHKPRDILQMRRMEKELL